MKKIVFIPLDERPCNLEYPLRLFKNRDDITVVCPPKSILGKKRFQLILNRCENLLLIKLVGRIFSSLLLKC